jgi:4'-phosphopantetheinyl transferase
LTEATLWVVDLAARRTDDSMLSSEERARADRFVFEDDRSRYVTGRTALRTLLGQELGLPPAAVPLESSMHGRPLCARLRGRLDFNLSNSGDVAVIAMAPQENVGVDVETFRPVHDALGLSRHYFSSTESRNLEQLDPAQRDRAFLTCWTRKEAVLKATGLGLSIAPASVETGIDASPATVRITEGSFELHTQPLHIQGEESAVVSLAMPRKAKRVHVRQFQFPAVHP